MALEKGGERLCAEIEDEMRGKKYTRLSIVGYSFGGLVARYAVGLLQAKGILDKIEYMVSTSGDKRRELRADSARTS